MGERLSEKAVIAYAAIGGAVVWTVQMMRETPGDKWEAAGMLLGCMVGAWVLLRGGLALWRLVRK